ncbi:hypothetical protein BDR06DRAFT_1008894 [Suillus hirtellus]|nr:hypothetical protein BDR06DRAFT_1008894 [Suillus hirtellus]
MSASITVVTVRSNRNQAEEDANNKSKRLRRELKVWPRLTRYIVPLYATVSSFGQFIALVFPWYDNGSLSGSLKSHGQTVSVINRFQVLSEISAGLQRPVQVDLTGYPNFLQFPKKALSLKKMRFFQESNPTPSSSERTSCGHSFSWNKTMASGFAQSLIAIGVLSELLVHQGLQTVLSATNLKCTPQDVHAENDIQCIVQYAATRGIDVSEIDTHGHAAIIVATYTECVASFDAGQWTNFANEPPAGQRRFAFSEAYTFHLFANLTEAQYELVVGGEQILWSEQSGPQNVDPIPIGAALNVTEVLPRLHDVRYRMVQRGINAISLQPYTIYA